MASRDGGLTPEQRAELGELRAERATPEARADEAAERAAIEREFPPARPTAEMLAMLAMLRAERKRRKLKLRAVADRARMTRIALSRMERGQGNPTLASVGRVLDAMDLRLEYRLVAAVPPAPE